MSASSSTIRMSCAMGNRTQFRGPVGRIWTERGTGIAGEYQPHPCAATLAIFQHQLSQVIFHDLFDDSEAQPRALGSRRHIGLGEPLAALLRQAFTVILDDDQDLAVAVGHRDPNLSWRALAGLDDSRLDRFDRILADVD